jgi:hypothetical protein
MIKTTQEQWQRNQNANKAAGKPTKPLGMLVRPWATQTSLADFSAAEYPPGSSSSVKPPSWCNKQQQQGKVSQESAALDKKPAGGQRGK